MTHPGPQFRPPTDQARPPEGWSPQPPPMPPSPPRGGWYQAPSPPPPQRRNGLLILAIVAVVVVLAVLAGYLLRPRGNPEASPEPSGPTAIGPIPTPESTTPEPTETATMTHAPQQREAPSPVPSDLVTVHPEVPVPTPTTVGPDPTNPGYNSEEGRGGFIQPRESRPAVEAPDATPEQSWPNIPDPGPWTGPWQTVIGDRGSYQVPSEWQIEKPGLRRGYQTMGRTIVASTLAVHGPDACQGETDLSYVGLVKPAKDTDSQEQARLIAHQWALLINTEWEGDYYLVPEPVTMEFPFSDGTQGYLSTVTFVPRTQQDCDFPAMRVSVAVRGSQDATYSHGIIAVSYVGKEGELGLTLERQVLSSFAPHE